MLSYIKNAIIAANVRKTVNVKGEKIHIMKDGKAYAEVNMNQSEKPVFVLTRVPHWAV